MLSETFSWWARQMRDLLPARWRRPHAGPAHAVVVAWDDLGGAADLLLRRDHREAVLGRFSLDEVGLRMARALLGGRRAPATVLRLPPGFLLERTVTLPLAAEQGLDQVMRYEMDRFTPFTAAEVCWSSTVRRRDRAQGKLALDIALVPRVRLAPLIEALTQLGRMPTMLEAEAAGGGQRRIPFGEPDLRRARRQRRLLAVAAACCGAMALAAVGLPFLLQYQASESVEARIAALQPRVAEVAALRRRMADAASGSDAVAGEQARVGDALHAVALLTDLLGDDTHLTGLGLHQRHMTLEGQSSAAARLITALSADPMIRNAAFAAPVMHAESGADLFAIKVEVAP
jgi:general secretion pathway protein L